MKTVTFSNKSWHYRMAQHFNDGTRDLTNICGYTRAVISGMIWFVIMTSLATGLAFSTIDFLIFIGVGFFINWSYLNYLAIPAAAISSLMAMGGVVWCGQQISRAGERWFNRKSKSQAPNFVFEAYDSISNKLCFKVDISRKQ